MRVTAASTAWRLAIAGLLLIAVGFAAVLVASFQGMQLQDGLSLIDGYWVGLLPWIEVGTWLIPIGGVLAMVGAGAAVWLRPSGWPLRLATLPAIAVGVFWVLLVAIETAPRNAMDGSISQTSVATAVYSNPANTVVFLLLPAAFVMVLGGMSDRVHGSRSRSG